MRIVDLTENLRSEAGVALCKDVAITAEGMSEPVIDQVERDDTVSRICVAVTQPS